MVWNRTIVHTMPGAPEIFHEWDKLFYIHERELTWRDQPIVLHATPFVASILYIWMVYQLPSFLMNHPGLRKSIQAAVKPMMIGWNLFLCVLSVFMFVGIAVPTYFFWIQEGSWGVVCNTDENVIPPSTLFAKIGVVLIVIFFFSLSCIVGSHIFWTAVFGYSKFLELLDTFFLILKNPERPVPFLHWYHHFSVLYFTWYAANWKVTMSPCLIFPTPSFFLCLPLPLFFLVPSLILFFS